jgi:uncharacterized protein YciI
MKQILQSFAFLIILASCSLGQSGPFLFVFLNTNPNKPELPKEQVDSIMAGHMANINRLAEEGKLIAAGPFYGGGGIFVLSTASTDSGRSWLKSDPGVRANRWIIEMIPYVPRIGSVCSVAKDYTMTSYTFVRYSRSGSAMKASVPEESNEHLEYINTALPKDSVVAEGVFSDGSGSVLVLRGEWDEAVFLREVAVQKKTLEVSLKRIYIAKGAFCEN